MASCGRFAFISLLPSVGEKKMPSIAPCVRARVNARARASISTSEPADGISPNIVKRHAIGGHLNAIHF